MEPEVVFSENAESEDAGPLLGARGVGMAPGKARIAGIVSFSAAAQVLVDATLGLVLGHVCSRDHRAGPSARIVIIAGGGARSAG